MSIDPITKGIPDDPLIGFLPPNIKSPEGEGSISYTVMPKTGLPTGTNIRNIASITFDYNAPILTPAWVNTIDNTKPTSAVMPLSATQTTTSFTVSWRGSDIGSGVYTYSVYYSTNDSAYVPWISNSTGTSATFVGEAGKVYRFYSIAEDSVGNRQDMPSAPDAITRVVPSGGAIPVNAPIDNFILWPVFPNPFNHTTNIVFDVPTPSRITIDVTDASGHRIETLADRNFLPGRHVIIYTARQPIQTGVYFIRMRANGYSKTQKLVFVR